MKRFSFSQRSKEESPSEGSTPSGPNSAAPSPQVENKVFNMLRKHSLKQPTSAPPEPPTKRVVCVPELVPKTFPAQLNLPPVIAPTPPETRELELQRRNTGDFGFSLRRTTMLDRSPDGGVYRRVVHFAEPGAGTKDLALGLVPGDRLVEINGRNVENKSRDEIDRGDDSTVRRHGAPQSPGNPGAERAEPLLAEEYRGNTPGLQTCKASLFL